MKIKYRYCPLCDCQLFAHEQSYCFNCLYDIKQKNSQDKTMNTNNTNSNNLFQFWNDKFLRLDAESQFTINNLRRDLKIARTINMALAIAALLASTLYLSEARADAYDDMRNQGDMQRDADTAQRAVLRQLEQNAWQAKRDAEASRQQAQAIADQQADAALMERMGAPIPAYNHWTGQYR
jgi:hypothetical protein